MISIDCIEKDTARTPDARNSPCKPFLRRRNRAPTISWPRPTVSPCIRVPQACQRRKLERLCRYIARPAVAINRLERARYGRWPSKTKTIGSGSHASQRTRFWVFRCSSHSGHSQDPHGFPALVKTGSHSGVIDLPLHTHRRHSRVLDERLLPTHTRPSKYRRSTVCFNLKTRIQYRR